MRVAGSGFPTAVAPQVAEGVAATVAGAVAVADDLQRSAHTGEYFFADSLLAVHYERRLG